jgi:hypothetical protein
VPPFPSSGAQGGVSSGSARCPRCGLGELVDALVGLGPAPGVWAFYCAGVYDRERRRLVQRSCGYLGAGGAFRAAANSSPEFHSGGRASSATRQPT